MTAISNEINPVLSEHLVRPKAGCEKSNEINHLLSRKMVRFTMGSKETNEINQLFSEQLAHPRCGRKTRNEINHLVSDKMATATGSYPSARSIRHALDVLFRLPHEAFAELAAHMVDRLDAIEPDPDFEEDNEDCCEAGDDDPQLVGAQGRFIRFGPGDDVDAECNGDDEPDDEFELARAWWQFEAEQELRP